MDVITIISLIALTAGLSLFPILAEYDYDTYILNERIEYLNTVSPEKFDENKFLEYCRKYPAYKMHDTIIFKIGFSEDDY